LLNLLYLYYDLLIFILTLCCSSNDNISFYLLIPSSTLSFLIPSTKKLKRRFLYQNIPLLSFDLSFLNIRCISLIYFCFLWTFFYIFIFIDPIISIFNIECTWIKDRINPLLPLSLIIFENF
jgi:hypothetical protein